MKHVMLDIESMSTHKHNALVLSVGLVRFSLLESGPVLFENKLVVLDTAHQLFLGREVDPSTQKWWKQQESYASEHWRAPCGLTCSLRDGLHSVKDFATADGINAIWARGIDFDIGNIYALFRELEIAPWHYRMPRDVRTITSCNKRARFSHGLEGLVPHNPIDDCKAQIFDLWDHWAGDWDDA